MIDPNEFDFLDVPKGVDLSDSLTCEVKVGTKCSFCGMPQFTCPSGITCQNGHGGAPSAEPTDEPADASLLMNPLTGALVDVDDLDSLIMAAVDTKRQLQDLASFEDTIRRRIGDLSQGTAKTRRVRGKTLVAKVEMPDGTWDQSMLKEAWNAYPQLRDEFLRLAKVDVRLIEFKKLAGTSSDDPAFVQFQQMLLGAQRPPTGAPRISLEGAV